MTPWARAAGATPPAHYSWFIRWYMLSTDKYDGEISSAEEADLLWQAHLCGNAFLKASTSAHTSCALLLRGRGTSYASSEVKLSSLIYSASQLLRAKSKQHRMSCQCQAWVVTTACYACSNYPSLDVSLSFAPSPLLDIISSFKWSTVFLLCGTWPSSLIDSFEAPRRCVMRWLMSRAEIFPIKVCQTIKWSNLPAANEFTHSDSNTPKRRRPAGLHSLSMMAYVIATST